MLHAHTSNEIVPLMNLETLKAEEAGIDNLHISENAIRVVEKLQEAGFQAYLVGGCVRDLLLNSKPKDFDVATNATPDEIKSTFGRNARIIGRRFKLVHVRFGYEVIEVATFRANASDREDVDRNQMSEGDQGQLLRDNVFGSIEEDVVRRDFRANSLYYDPVAGDILDFMGGIQDIKDKKLVSIGDPEQRFTEDPVRMLRVVRFAAKLGFEMEPKAKEMIEQQGSLLSHVSSARLFEEVLKLFHGGAAYDTYLMLREYGLFKYLFPFTDQVAVEGVEGMPERALQNTDKRIHAGKPVIPAFLFACMLWDPVKADAQILMEDGTTESQAWRVAMNDALRDQNQYVAVPRRLADIILDIWNIHFRLLKRNPRMVKTSLNNRRFRAAYDFLLLRTQVHEVDEDIGDWWTKIQEVDTAEREEMITELGEVYKKERQPLRNNNAEPDGNSINYNSVNYNGNVSGSYDDGMGNSYGNTQSKPGRGNGRPSNSKRKKQTKRGGKKGSQSANRSNRNNKAAGPKNNNGRRQEGGQNQRRRKGNGLNRGRRNNASGQDGRFVEARPRDEFGVYTSESPNAKKVKVRRKRRIVDPKADNETPHF